MKNVKNTESRRVEHSVHEELKKGFETWLWALPLFNQGPKKNTDAEQKMNPIPVHPSGQKSDQSECISSAREGVLAARDSAIKTN